MHKIPTLLIIVSILFTFNTNPVKAADAPFLTKKPMTFKEAYEANGYTTFKKAVKQFEKRFNAKVKLPNRIPFKVEYEYAKFYEELASVMFVSSGKNFSNYYLNITIFYKPEGSFTKDFNYQLNSGIMVSLHEHPKPMHHLTLSFKKDNLDYFISFSSENKDLEKAQILGIAESITK